MKKTTQNSPKSGKVATKRPRWIEDFQQTGTMRLKPVTDSYLERIGNEFVSWCAETASPKASKKRRYSLEKFLEEKGIPHSTMKGWRKRCEYLNLCIEHGKMILGNRLEEGLLNKELSEKATMYILHDYFERYKKADSYHDERKKHQQSSILDMFKGITFDLPPLGSRNEDLIEQNDNDN